MQGFNMTVFNLIENISLHTARLPKDSMEAPTEDY